MVTSYTTYQRVLFIIQTSLSSCSIPALNTISYKMPPFYLTVIFHGVGGEEELWIEECAFIFWGYHLITNFVSQEILGMNGRKSTSYEEYLRDSLVREHQYWFGNIFLKIPFNLRFLSFNSLILVYYRAKREKEFKNCHQLVGFLSLSLYWATYGTM